MKTLSRRLPLLAALGAALLLAACGDAGEAVSVSTVCSPVGAMDSTYAGGNQQNGAMFSLVGGADGVNISSFAAHDAEAAGTPSDWEIYYRPGSYTGSEGTPSDWTLVGSATGVASQGPGNPTPLPIAVNVFIPLGETYSFYVTRTDGSLVEYTNGTSEGAVFASDGNVGLLEGVGIAYPFDTSLGIFSPRVFNGTVQYGCP